LLVTELLTLELLRSAVLVKRASAQVDGIVHATGMLLGLPEILEDGESIKAVSLAAEGKGRESHGYLQARNGCRRPQEFVFEPTVWVKRNNA
jgi:hypothetical protein